MDLRLMNIMMVISFKGCMRIIRRTDLESIHLQMEHHMKATIKMTIDMDLEYSDIVMVISGWATGRMTKKMVQDLN